jgi:hypothetical protein
MKIDYFEPISGIVIILIIIAWATGIVHWLVALAIILTQFKIKIPLR